MGHIVNPISFRLGTSKYWSSTWAVSNLKSSYSYMVNQDAFIQDSFWGLFHRRFGFLGRHLKDLLPAGIQIVRSHNKVSLFCEFYYSQTAVLRYLLVSYFDRIFDVEFLKNIVARARLSLKARDLELYSSFKGAFIEWAWLHLIQPVQNQYWLSLKQTLCVVFSRLLSPNAKVDVFVREIEDQQVTAMFLARFIAVKLEQGVAVRRVLGLVRDSLSSLVDQKVLLGFRIKLSGRFSRIQQASCTVSGGGVLGRNEITTDVDYAFQTANLKFSVCGVKVLLARPLSTALSVKNSTEISAQKLSSWVDYIPEDTYSRWQRGQLSAILKGNATSTMVESSASFI